MKFEQEVTSKLCDQVFVPVWDESLKSTPEGQRKKFMGCYHMNYYLRGELIAIGVLDFMRSGFSSVYFFYEPKYKDYRLGVVSSII